METEQSPLEKMEVSMTRRSRAKAEDGMRKGIEQREKRMDFMEEWSRSGILHHIRNRGVRQIAALVSPEKGIDPIAAGFYGLWDA